MKFRIFSRKKIKTLSILDLVMACGPVDRRANRAETARAGPGQEKPARAGPYGPARAGSARRGPGFSRWARRAEKKY